MANNVCARQDGQVLNVILQSVMLVAMDAQVQLPMNARLVMTLLFNW